MSPKIKLSAPARVAPLSVRMRAAVEALPFESPKLTATALLTSDDFASLLDRAIERSNGVREVKQIRLALPQPE
jgi:hypothetical protein